MYEPDKDKIKENLISRLKACRTEMDKLQISRATALKYYMAEEIGTTTAKELNAAGRSSVVMSDVADVIEWIKPALMKIFYGGQSVVDVRAQGEEDDLKAPLMAEKLNFDFQVALDGFKILYTWFNDALIFKMGVLKYSWLEDFEYTTVSYKNTPEQDYYNLQTDPNFIIDEVTPQNEAGLNAEGYLIPATYKITGRKKTRISKPMVENVPPEEFIFDQTMRDIEDLHGFVAHKLRIKKCHLIANYGLKEDEIDGEVANFNNSDNVIVYERFKDLGGVSFLQDTDKDYFWIYECCYYDFDENATPIPKMDTVFGDRIIKSVINKYDRPNYCVLSPILMSHRLCGRSYVDIVKDIMLMRTQMLRMIMDNNSYQNNARAVINPYRCSYDEALNSNAPGRYIRTLAPNIDPASCVYPMPVLPLAPQVFNMFENALPEMRMDRTGVTKYNQGLDSKTLNKTATGISQIMSAAQQRIELIARIIAETGMKDLFTQLAYMNIKFFDKEISIKINNDWQVINPMSIDGTFDIIIDVGIGTGSKEIAFNQKERMLNIYQMIAKALRGDMMAITQIYDTENIKEILKEMWKDQGYKNAENKFLAKGGVLDGRIPITNSGGNGGGGTAPIRQPPNQEVLRQYGGGTNPRMEGMPTQ